ncbi:ferritin-like domain-containing protein [Dyadobacter sp. 32]|uniref:ferritin-like domain-containing protein n=1 Tax=Dyadobacter sp. 32 TaxID=538966 RepID=UPI0011EE38A6
MNFLNILENLEKVDGDFIDRIKHTSRRHFMNRISTRMATVAAPAIFASVLGKAYAQTTAGLDVLNYALFLEYLEDEFYKMGNATSGLVMDPYKTVFAQIGKHETQHVVLLEGALGDKKIAKPEFNFTKNFPTAFTSFDTFVFLSHAFEDTGVRAYKGRAGDLLQMADLPFLKVALQIHSVEARHASISRRILAKIRNNPAIKGWITNDEGSPEPVYKGSTSEATVVQLGLNLLDFDMAGIPKDALFKAASEAFDEVLTVPEVTQIAGLFTK